MKRCAACGASLQGPARFCPGCGSAVAAPEPRPLERRTVSVLCCDLVGFTTFAEGRDPEQVRAVLAGYYELGRAVVARYGGVVDKFVGDAVVAIWGAPVAHEDDAERAVRAALELAAAVPSAASEHAVELRARVGVATSTEAIASDSLEGLVLGGAVLVASRLQSLAASGTCVVDAPTRRRAEQAIAFEEAPLRLEDGQPLYQALHVVSGIRGRRHSSSLEAPLTGRDVELQMLKSLFHASAEHASGRLVSVAGPPGVGKSRLAWELEKYLDGLVETVLWHSAPCLAYGEGIAFWALAEMVRSRLGIAEDEPAASAAPKFAEGLVRFVPPGERRDVGTCVARLLGLPDPTETGERDDASEAGAATPGAGGEAPPGAGGVGVAPRAGGDAPAPARAGPVLAREQLFAGWRRFFESLAAVAPVVLVLEDAEYADDGLLDFIDHLVDFAGPLPIFVLVLARPELLERRPGFGSGRHRSSLALDPLTPASMERLFDQLVPGLPTGPRAALIDRAGGIPLFAVETVRALRDPGQPAPDGTVPSELAVPETLRGLIASRLDALDQRARRLVGVASVIGSTFDERALLAVSGRSEAEVRAALAELVQRDLLQARPAPLAERRGGFGFSHGLLRQVAYETLSRRDRRTHHLATAAHLRASFPNDGEEVAHLVARHYLDALALAPRSARDPDYTTDIADAAGTTAGGEQELRRQAITMLVRAAERDERIGAPASAAAHFFAAATELAAAPGFRPTLARGEELDVVELWLLAALAHRDAGSYERAFACADTALRTARTAGDDRGAAHAQVTTARVLANRGRYAEARPLLDEALPVLRRHPERRTVVALGDLVFAQVMSGEPGAALATSDEALALADELGVDDRVLTRPLAFRGMALRHLGEREQAIACLEESLRIAERAGDLRAMSMSYDLLTDTLGGFDLAGAVETAEAARAISRRLGIRIGLVTGCANTWSALLELGDWDGAQAALEQAVEDGVGDEEIVACLRAVLSGLRGDRGGRAEGDGEGASSGGPTGDDGPRSGGASAAGADTAARAGGLDRLRASSDPQDLSLVALADAYAAAAGGHTAEAIGAARRAFEQAPAVGAAHDAVRWCWPLAARLAHELGDAALLDELGALLAAQPPGEIPPGLRAGADLARARALAAGGGDTAAATAAFEAAIQALRLAGNPYHLAGGLLDHAEHLTRGGEREVAEAAIGEALAIGERLACRPLLERARSLPVALA